MADPLEPGQPRPKDLRPATATEAAAAQSWIDRFKALGGRFTTVPNGSGEMIVFIGAPIDDYTPQMAAHLSLCVGALRLDVVALAKQELGL